MRKKKQAGGEIAPIGYNPPATYKLHLEIFPVSALKQRVGVDYSWSLERIEFHLLIYITEGRCTHVVDFESIVCGQGSLLMLQPGQVQRFDMTTEWQGWLVIFRPEFLLPIKPTALVPELEMFHHLEELPAHLALKTSEQNAVVESITRMFHDIQLNVNTSIMHMLLRNQLQALLNRLHLIAALCEQVECANTVLLKRFELFRRTVEQNFHREHRVTEYAKRLGCSEKSLCRAVQAVSGSNTKVFLSKRIALEAKRLLIFTCLPISVIGHQLGFDEATNFVKFFRHEAGCSPSDFRRQISQLSSA